MSRHRTNSYKSSLRAERAQIAASNSATAAERVRGLDRKPKQASYLTACLGFMLYLVFCYGWYLWLYAFYQSTGAFSRHGEAEAVAMGNSTILVEWP